MSAHILAIDVVFYVLDKRPQPPECKLDSKDQTAAVMVEMAVLTSGQRDDSATLGSSNQYRRIVQQEIFSKILGPDKVGSSWT